MNDLSSEGIYMDKRMRANADISWKHRKPIPLAEIPTSHLNSKKKNQSLLPEADGADNPDRNRPTVDTSRSPGRHKTEHPQRLLV